MKSVFSLINIKLYSHKMILDCNSKGVKFLLKFLKFKRFKNTFINNFEGY